MNFLELLNRGNLVGAHRGASKNAPENTLCSMKASIGHCDFIEIDVQLSSDGVALIIHDETLNRTTDGSGKISDFSFKELNRLDYGSWFDGKHEPLLTLSEALKFIKENNIFLNIEIKDIHDNFSDEKVVSTVLKEIEEGGVQMLVMLSSFRAEYLPLCKEKRPTIPTALLVWNKHPERLTEYLKELQVDAYNMNDELVDKKSIDKLKKAGYFVNVYTVNSSKRRKELFKMGVTGVFSDF